MILLVKLQISRYPAFTKHFNESSNKMSTTLNNIVLLTVIFFGLTACNRVNTQATKQNPIIPTDTFATAAINNNASTDPIRYDETIFPTDSLFQVEVLTTGIFHEDEVPENADQQKWFGLFKGMDGFYLEQTPISTRRVHDPVLDENDTEKTGWEVSTAKKDTNYILIEAIPFLQNIKVQHVPLDKNYIYPGDTLKCSHLGIDYKLFATGEKKKVQEDPEAFDVWNYKLFMAAYKGGHQITQLLVAQPSFDDTMIEVLFAGDIDGDDMLDLIIDTSGHYNALSPTIYLSKPADKKELVKPVGGHTRVGC